MAATVAAEREVAMVEEVKAVARAEEATGNGTNRCAA